MCAARPKKSPSIYGVYPGVIRDHGAEVDLRTKAKNGRSLDEWMALAEQGGPPRRKRPSPMAKDQPRARRQKWLQIAYDLDGKSLGSASVVFADEYRRAQDCRPQTALVSHRRL